MTWERRIIAVVEGQTEEAFVKLVLAPHFLEMETAITPIIVATKRERGGKKHKGGGRSAARWLNDIRIVCKQPGPHVRVTTFFDLYGLPTDFPGVQDHGGERNTTRRAELLEKAMSDAIADWRFIPYLQRHEFESLVLAALPQLLDRLDAQDDREAIAELQRELGELPPEDVNDGDQTHPSRRLGRVTGYTKLGTGPDAVRDAGLVYVRARCPRFDAWLTRLESFARPGADGVADA